MNPYMKIQIRNMEAAVENFRESCELAAKQDDGVIGRDEARQLKKIRKACEHFRKELERIG